MRVVNAEQMRRIENQAINEYGIPSILLMENAAMAVVQEIRQYLSDQSNKDINSCKIVVLAGKGNNGGDGLAVARHLLLLGAEVTVFLFAKPQDLRGDAAINLRLFRGAEGKFFVVDGDKQKRIARLALAQADVVVDAIYGIGLKGALPSIVEEYVEEVNRSKAWVIAVDIPSGVEADTGMIYRIAIRANSTVTFGLPKIGHLMGDGLEYCGRLIVDPISIPGKYLIDEIISNFVITPESIRNLVPVRRLQGHKGTHGRGVLIAGSQGMSGAAILAGRAALRSGIGLLQIITPLNLSNSIDQMVIEATLWPAPGENFLTTDSWSVISERSKGAQALAVGPGLGQNADFISVLGKILHLNIPVVLDADALNLIANKPELLALCQQHGNVILTPHPGEMARLCQCTTAEIQKNRLEYAVTKAVEWGAIIVLKGAVTIVAAPDGRAFLNPKGNPGLGTGGTGDVLTGTILGYLAQGVPALEAACLSVYLHGKAADHLAKNYGWSGFTASEVADTIANVKIELERYNP